MWHEARRQERKIRGLMVDYKRRADRRKEFYEKIKQDPTQFLRVYGRPCKINFDPAVALAAESPQSMMPWQGDTSNMIDRFDVRAHLDIIPETPSAKVPELSKDEEQEERICNYERYRTLVENEASGLSEEQCLYEIYIDEQFGSPTKQAEDEKKKNADKKVAIGYTYEDNVTLDVDTLTIDQEKEINSFAHHYGMKEEDFVSMLRKDKEELEALKHAKQIEEEKAQFSGRKSRRERRAFKEKQLRGRRISPPSYAARSSPKYEPYRRFGAESDEEGAAVQGPALPPTGSGARSDPSATFTTQNLTQTGTPHGRCLFLLLLSLQLTDTRSPAFLAVLACPEQGRGTGEDEIPERGSFGMHHRGLAGITGTEYLHGQGLAPRGIDPGQGQEGSGLGPLVRTGHMVVAFEKKIGGALISSGKLTPQERLKRKMQAQLNKQYKADKKAEVSKLSKIEQERMDREEELRMRTMEMRRREREKRHKELEQLERERHMRRGGSGSRSSEDDSPRHRHRDRSYSRSLSPMETGGKYDRSGSRSRSRSRSSSSDRVGLVSY
ncbi:hypothetical protein BaRGS_00001927 [Batillaria attramentaria]|uniref:Suppressor of white apricot N-terminal domain-containing protein n=1 Tax=Batillaria attramentaria TaxID=370345 RepID=A0ABD0M6T7_9CAEN